jgi:hypothetical protein
LHQRRKKVIFEIYEKIINRTNFHHPLDSRIVQAPQMPISARTFGQFATWHNHYLEIMKLSPNRVLENVPVVLI